MINLVPHARRIHSGILQNSCFVRSVRSCEKKISTLRRSEFSQWKVGKTLLNSKIFSLAWEASTRRLLSDKKCLAITWLNNKILVFQYFFFISDRNILSSQHKLEGRENRDFSHPLLSQLNMPESKSTL